MTSPARFLFTLALGASIVGPAWALKDDPATQLANLTKGHVAGKPQRCISLSDVNDSQVIDKTAIVYRVGNTWYVNRMKSGANSLNSDNVPVTHTFGSQLCEMDTVKMVDRYGGGSRGFAILGQFVPYKPVSETP